MESNKFKTELPTRWSDVDSNQHVRHSVYLDLCASARMNWLEAVGFPAPRLVKMGLGPILFREEVFYEKELFLGESVNIEITITKLSESGHKFSIEHQLFNVKGTRVARLYVDGAWFNVKERAVSPPGTELLAVMNSIHQPSS